MKRESNRNWKLNPRECVRASRRVHQHNSFSSFDSWPCVCRRALLNILSQLVVQVEHSHDTRTSHDQIDLLHDTPEKAANNIFVIFFFARHSKIHTNWCRCRRHQPQNLVQCILFLRCLSSSWLFFSVPCCSLVSRFHFVDCNWFQSFRIIIIFVPFHSVYRFSFGRVHIVRSFWRLWIYVNVEHVKKVYLIWFGWKLIPLWSIIK